MISISELTGNETSSTVDISQNFIVDCESAFTSRLNLTFVTTFKVSRNFRHSRAQLNDLENIPIFIAIALAYQFTNPDPVTTTLLFKTFTFARVAYTFVYAVYVIPQPARAIAFIAGEIVTWYMIIKCARNFY